MRRKEQDEEEREGLKWKMESRREGGEGKVLRISGEFMKPVQRSHAVKCSSALAHLLWLEDSSESRHCNKRRPVLGRVE